MIEPFSKRHTFIGREPLAEINANVVVVPNVFRSTVEAKIKGESIVKQAKEGNMYICSNINRWDIFWRKIYPMY